MKYSFRKNQLFFAFLIFFTLAGATGVVAEEKQGSSPMAISCATCHASGDIKIDNYNPEQLKKLLMQYANPGNTVMHRLIRGFTEKEIETIANNIGEKKQ